MTRQLLEHIVRDWQQTLGLERWKLDIEWDELPDYENARASIWRSSDYDEAKLYLAADWPEWALAQAHQIVAHEMLHLVLRDVEVVLDLLSGQLQRDLYETIRRSHMHHVEQAVDRLAYRLVELVNP